MTREELHQLVSTLPEGALGPAKQALQHFRIWPQQPFLQIERMRQKHREGMRGSARTASPGPEVSGEGHSTASGEQVPSGRFSVNHWEGSTSVVETHIFHDGHEVIVTERLVIADDGKSLEYESEIVGPKGSSYSQKLSFDIEEDSQ